MPQLDALRAFAVLAVIVEHYGGRALNAWIPISAGYSGVGLFFTLSGFLITSLLLSTFAAYGSDHGVALRNFYVRRLLRLAPPFYLVLFVLVAIGLEPIASSWPWHAAYLSNVWIALGNPSNVLWSLAVEEQFYLFWPVILLAAGTSRALHLAASVIIAGIVFRLGWAMAGLDQRIAGYLLFGNLTLLGAGSALGVVCYRNGRPFQFDWVDAGRRRLLDGIAGTCLALALVPWLLWGPQGLLRFLTLDILMGTVFTWLVLRTAMGWSGRTGWIMTRPPLLFIGKISYMIYLTHNFIPRIYEHYLGPLPKGELLALTIPTLAAVCVLSWFLIEKPLLKLKAFAPDRPDNADGRRDAIIGTANGPAGQPAAAANPPAAR